MSENYDLFITNLTLSHCKIQHANNTASLINSEQGEFCDVTFDSILCWPPTPINKTAVIKCFSELFGIRYDDTRKYKIFYYCYFHYDFYFYQTRFMESIYFYEIKIGTKRTNLVSFMLRI